MNQNPNIFYHLAKVITSGAAPTAVIARLEDLYPSDHIAAAMLKLAKLGLIAVDYRNGAGRAGKVQLRWSCQSFGKITELLVSLIDRIVADIDEIEPFQNCPIRCSAGWYPVVRTGTARGSTSAAEPPHAHLDVASGRGTTLAEATLGCLAEAAERYSMQCFGRETLVRSTIAELGDRAVPPQSIMCFSEQQYRRRAAWNHGLPQAVHIPSPCPSDRAIDWLPVVQGLSTADLLVPAACNLLGHPSPFEQGQCVGDSSGCAAGETLEAASVRGFLELVERDAVAIWWYNRIRRPRLSLATLCDPLLAAYEEWSASRKRRIDLLDLTHDLSVPVVAAVSADENGQKIALGFAAASDLLTAAQQAVGELVQFEINAALVEECRQAGDDDWSFLTWCRTASLEDNPALVPIGEVDSIADDRENWSVRRCHELCRRHGLEFLVIDCTRDGIGVPVARTIVPGLRPHWPRFGPGRLYDVPVELGWLGEARTEGELNPRHILY